MSDSIRVGLAALDSAIARLEMDARVMIAARSKDGDEVRVAREEWASFQRRSLALRAQREFLAEALTDVAALAPPNAVLLTREQAEALGIKP